MLLEQNLLLLNRRISQVLSSWIHVQVMLYDECDKLLECRLLKKDEIVTSGETLTFNGYLIDIGDPEEGNNSISDSNVDRTHKNIARRPNRLNGFKSRIPSGIGRLSYLKI